MTQNIATAAPPPLEADPLLDFATLPWRLAEAAHDLHLAWCHRWARHCLSSVYPPHPHEGPGQLEIPDPIAAAPEQDLFA